MLITKQILEADKAQATTLRDQAIANVNLLIGQIAYIDRQLKFLEMPEPTPEPEKTPEPAKLEVLEGGTP